MMYCGTWRAQTANVTSMGDTGAPEIVVAGVGSNSVDGSLSGTRTIQVFSQMINDGR